MRPTESGKDKEKYGKIDKNKQEGEIIKNLDLILYHRVTLIQYIKDFCVLNFLAETEVSSSILFTQLIARIIKFSFNKLWFYLKIY